ncbi:putative RNA editing complex protein MP90 putativenuclease [Leptomonas pyrrhocoris]|uniref:Putative RNA editing complex protein MP90 putativenuclease n=1 Tax=Leptomonas pyrrhocoris TaxID=157538 RepID=A0A0M9FSR8_LEPPY|nr:putative RNA editing complex protein MP90 putativenuclease [Leptomonas pyrrhocoris]KPA75305.1 putative RNA editing complex protein MP90 putativenuclease [Leptomonas pyrrhocoris]|eukprot:XP_015653744.1 putative RNA editing complex protein MP90 putativenuclease [Leptomonas pyrrhocoris]
MPTSPICRALTPSAVSRAASGLAAITADVAAGPLQGHPHNGAACALTTSSPVLEHERCSFSSTPCSASNLRERWRLPLPFCGGGLLHQTRLVRALKPVSSAHTDHRGYKGNYSPRFAAPLGQPLARPNVFEYASTSFSAPALVQVPRSPSDLLDDLPVYEPNDLNGPPRTRVNAYIPMRTLPFSDALAFYYRKQGTSSGGVRGVEDNEEDRRGPDSSSGSSRGGYSTYSTNAASDEARSDARYGRGRNENEENLYCRLCREEVRPEFTCRGHITASGLGSHVPHPVREVALDTMALLAIRGYPIDDILTVWAETLYHCPDLPRIHGLTNPRCSLEERAAHLGNLMYALKKIGVLDLALTRQGSAHRTVAVVPEMYRRRRVAFERLEYIGDSFWGVHISKRLVLLYPDQRWLYGERCYSFNAIRDACEMNVNLDFVFDILRIGNLVSNYADEGAGMGKGKADYVEAILGELHAYVVDYEPKMDDDVAFVEVNGAREAQLCALIQHCLTELYDLVVLQHARQLTQNALPLAKELAVKKIWLQTRPRLLQNKRSSRKNAVGRVGGLRSLRSSSNVDKELASVSGSVADAARFGASVKATESTGGLDVSYAASVATAPYEDLFDLSASKDQLADLNPEGSAASMVENVSVFNTVDASTKLVGDRSTGVHAAASAPLTATDADAETGDRATAVVTSTSSASVGAASSVIYTSSLSLASAIQRGTTRVLPGLPRLFQRPRALPMHVPHPLQNLPLSAIPKTTYCEHTHADIFAQIVESYHRLRLSSDDASQTRYVVSHFPPGWHLLIASLVPQLAHVMTRTDSAEPDGKLYDSFDNLFPSAGSSGTGDTETSKAATASADSDDGGGLRMQSNGTQSEEVTRRLFTSMDEGELYCRDMLYNLAPSPSTAAPQDTPLRFTPSVDWVRHHTGLRTLTLKPVHVEGSAIHGSSSSSSSNGSDGAAYSSFADSRFVPPLTRPPSAGVVTDRNLCRGVFPFLAFEAADPVKEATEALQEIHRRTTGGAPMGRMVEKANAESASGGADETAVAPQAKDIREESFAEHVVAALAYWKRQPRKLSADPDIFNVEKPVVALKKPANGRDVVVRV